MKKPRKKRDALGSQTLLKAAAWKCFERFGVSATTLADVAREAGLPPQLVNYYFPSFESLFLACFQQVIDELRDAMVTGGVAGKDVRGTTRSLLQAYVMASFEWARRNPVKMSVWLHAYGRAAFEGTEFLALNEAARNIGRQRIASILQAGAKDGEFDSKKIPEKAAMIQALLNGAIIVCATEGLKNSKQKWNNHALTTWWAIQAWL